MLLAPSAVPGWLARLEAEYLPGARRRGMRLGGVWTSHPSADAVEVRIVWELADVAAFWAMRRAAREDASVGQWWAATDAVALGRERRVYEAAETGASRW